MLVQVFIVIIALLLWQFKFPDKKGAFAAHKSANFMIIMCVLLILQAGLRHENCGADTYAYKMFWESYHELPWNKIVSDIQSGFLFDPGFYVFMKASQYIFPTYQLFLLLSAAVFVSALCSFTYRLIDRNFDVVWFVLIYECLFYSTLAECTIRQGYAVALCLYSYRFIENRKLIPFILTSLIASTFHGSAFAFLPFYFLHNTKKMTTVMVLAVITVPFLFSIKNEFVSFAVDTLNNEKYMGYKEVSDNSAHSFGMVYSLLFFLGVYFRNVYMKHKKEAPDMLMAMTLGFALLPMLFVKGTLMRVVQYYSIFMVVFVPTLYNCISKYKQQFKYVFVGLFIIFFMKIVVTNHRYAFFWQEMEPYEQQVERL